MARQERLKGIAKEIPAIEAAAKDYVAARDQRMELTKVEVAARDTLIAAMNEAEQEVYRTADGLLCTLTTTDKVKVSAAGGEAEEE